jgi:membrane-associated phospholipid phosphatase
MKNNLFFGIATLVCCAVSVAWTQNPDINLLKKINGHTTTDGRLAFTIVTNSVSPVSIALPVGLFVGGKLSKDKEMVWKSAEMTGTLLVSSIISTSMKYAFKRPRPFTTYPNDIVKHSHGGSPSFPSGHTSMAFGTATSVVLAYPKWYVAVPAFAWAVSVGQSRMYLGVHYPSDVAAGAIIGIGSAFLVHYGTKYLRRKLETKKALKL